MANFVDTLKPGMVLRRKCSNITETWAHETVVRINKNTITLKGELGFAPTRYPKFMFDVHFELVPPAPPAPKSYAPEVIADNSGKWVGNALRFATREEAQGNVENLMYRWTLVREIRVVESDDEPNYRWIPGQGLEMIPRPANNLCPLCGERRGAPGTHRC